MKPENRGKRDLSLQILALYLLFVVPIFVLILIYYQTASKRLEADIAAADLSLARAIALETDAMLVKAKDAVVAFAQDPSVIYADPTGMEQAFKAGAVARQDINLFYRLSADGIMLYHYPAGPTSTVGDDFSFRGYFQAALRTHEHTFSRGRISPTTGRPVVTSVMPVMVNGKFDGVVATNLELQRLTETLNRIVSKYQDRQAVKLIIVDATGQIIAHSEPEKLLEPDEAAIPGVDEALARREGSLQSHDAQGQEWLYTYTPVPIANWGVIVQRSSRQAFASLDTLRNGMSLALVVFTLGALFFWLALSRRFIAPLEKLTEYGQQVGRENYLRTISEGDLAAISRRQDQIGLLTRSILRAEHHIRQRLMELTILHKTSAAVVSTLDTRQVIDRILTETQRLLSVHQCALLVVDEANNQLEIKASRGLSQSYPSTINLTENPLDMPAVKAIETGRAVQIQDVETRSNASLLVSIARTEGYRSLLVVPLRAPHISMAALSIYRTDVHEFTEQEIDLATSFANFAAIALEHATLFNLTDAELQKRVRFLSALHRVGMTVSQSLVVDDVLDNAMEAVFEVMPAVACWIYLQPQAENHLRLRVHRGFSDELTDYLRTQTVFYGEGIIGQVAQDGQSLFLDEAQLVQKPWADDPIVAAGHWRSVGVAPLLAKETVIGVLGMAARQEKVFTPAEVELLEAIGNQIAIAVINARLYRRSREAATLEERNRVAREIHDTLAQGFTGILIQLQAAERLSRKHPEKAIESLQEARELARQSLQEARRSVLNLRPAVLENLTLDQAIAQIANQFQSGSGIATRFLLEGYPFTLDPDVKQNLYRITQEALTNVSRHAQASQVDISLIFEPQSIELNIHDNGIGLNGVSVETNGRNGVSAARLSGEGFGLIGITERVNLMKGQVWFNNPPEGGAEVKVVVPK